MPQGQIVTTDIFKGAYFLSCGCDLERVSFERNPEIAEFWIIGLGIEKMDRDYRIGDARVNPVQFREALNNLRDLLFKEKRRNGETRPR